MRLALSPLRFQPRRWIFAHLEILDSFFFFGLFLEIVDIPYVSIIPNHLVYPCFQLLVLERRKGPVVITASLW